MDADDLHARSGMRRRNHATESSEPTTARIEQRDRRRHGVGEQPVVVRVEHRLRLGLERVPGVHRNVDSRRQRPDLDPEARRRDRHGRLGGAPPLAPVHAHLAAAGDDVQAGAPVGAQIGIDGAAEELVGASEEAAGSARGDEAAVVGRADPRAVDRRRYERQRVQRHARRAGTATPSQGS